MTSFNPKMLNMFKGLISTKMLEDEVAKEWRKKATCLKDLKNKEQLKELDLKLLKGLKYKGKETESLFKELKESQKITVEQKEFAKFLYEEYPKHSVKAMGF